MQISENGAMSSPAGATASQRRKSGRAVRAPEKFQPEVSSQNAGGSGKRKRAGADVEDGQNEEDEDNEGEDEEDDEDEESDEEEAPVKKRAKPTAATTKKAPAAKKAKVNGNAPPALRLPNRAKKHAGKVVFKDQDAEGLYGELKAVSSALMRF